MAFCNFNLADVFLIWGDGNAITGMAVCTLSDGRWKATAQEDPSIVQGDKRTGSFSCCVDGVFGTPELWQNIVQVSDRPG